jgi:transcriptional regulator with XRE-family HTH domain
MSTVGSRIKTLREQQNLTQDRLAELTGISKGFISDSENDKRNMSSQNLLKIADALNASLEYLLRGTILAKSQTGQEPVVIPQELSVAAEELKLSYAETLELLNAHRSVIAKRSVKGVRSLTSADWKALHQAIKSIYG